MVDKRNDKCMSTNINAGALSSLAAGVRNVPQNSVKDIGIKSNNKDIAQKNGAGIIAGGAAGATSLKKGLSYYA